MSLSVHELSRKARLGSKEAAAIYPIRRRGNQLLTTLLLGNVAVNSALAIYLGSIASGVVAGIIATALIFILGEIVPQAVTARHAMRVGAATAPLVRILMFVAWPITFPISYALDKLLGEELPTVYSKRELIEIIAEHEDSEHSPIDRDEERILHGALQFSHTPAHAVMTVREQVHMFEADEVLDDTLRKAIIETGQSRFPVYRRQPDSIIGILYTKDVLIEPKHVTVLEACERAFLLVRPNETLDTVMALMLKRKMHMGIIIDHDDRFVGVVTLEDILEEVIQTEILDEDDRVIENS
jgi:metal transporter CNNM